jgi:hypothetical protein
VKNWRLIPPQAGETPRWAKMKGKGMMSTRAVIAKDKFLSGYN